MDMAVNLDDNEQQVERTLNASDLAKFDSIAGNTWENQSIQGSFVDYFQERDVNGLFESKKGEIYTSRVFKLMDIEDSTLKLRLTIWGRADSPRVQVDIETASLFQLDNPV